MAQDGKEHRMLFDIRGKRRGVVKVVYAVLAVLMGLSLFLVTGAGSISGIFDSGGASTSAATEGLEEQTQRIQRKVRQDPQNPDLLLALTRAQINTGNSMLAVNPETGGAVVTPEGKAEYEHASETWERYLEAAEEPNPGAAAIVAGTLFKLAESPGSTLPETQANIKAATEAQEIAARARPTLNSLSTLAIYQLYSLDVPAATKSEAEAKKFVTSKFEREQLENEMTEYAKRASLFRELVEKSEKAAKQGGAGAGAGQEQLQNPLGGSGLTGQ